MFTVTVQPVNDPPSFTMGPDRSVDENCGAVTVTGWATDISAGPADETDAGLAFTVTTDNDALFDQLPTVSAAGDLSFTPATDMSGSAIVTVVLSDGEDETAARTFSIVVNPVIEPPSFTIGADQDVDEDCGEVMVSGWATAVSAGPADESGQTVTFTVSTDNDDLFALLPSIDATGVLSFTPADNANGSATVTVALSDDGGTTNGGDDSADP